MAKFRCYNEDTGFTECVVDYWDRLKELKLYSLERRRERYMIVYMYKLHIGLVPDLGFLSDTGRNGVKYFAKENPDAPKEVRSIRISSFFFKGPLLFNILPKELRTPARPNGPVESKKLLERFKRWLDKWLELIPDQPTTDETSGRRGADSNSLVDQMRANKIEVNRLWDRVRTQLEKEDQEREESARERNESAEDER